MVFLQVWRKQFGRAELASTQGGENTTKTKYQKIKDTTETIQGGEYTTIKDTTEMLKFQKR